MYVCHTKPAGATHSQVWPPTTPINGGGALPPVKCMVTSLVLDSNSFGQSDKAYKEGMIEVVFGSPPLH